MAGADRLARLPDIESGPAVDHFQSAGDGYRSLYPGQLPDGLWQYPSSAVAFELAGAWRRRRAAGHLLCRSHRLGDLPHRYAGQGVRSADGVRRLCDAALSRRHRLDPAGGAEFRLAEQGLDGADRRHPRRLQYLFDDRPDPGDRRDVVSLHVRIHQFGARPGLVGNGGRRQYPRRPHAADHAAHNPAAGDARHHRRHHHQLFSKRSRCSAHRR